MVYGHTVELLVDENSLSDVTNGRQGQQHVDKAPAEEFIHVFVNNRKKLTEFLEHMIKVRYFHQHVDSRSFISFVYLTQSHWRPHLSRHVLLHASDISREQQRR